MVRNGGDGARARLLGDDGRRPTVKHVALLAVGGLSLGLGGIGIVLPVLPTTPFVLLAAACFSASSPSLARRLEHSRIFGSYLRHWRTREGVPARTKARAIAWLWLGLAVSAAILREPAVIAVLGIVGTLVTLHLVTIRTAPDHDGGPFAAGSVDP